MTTEELEAALARAEALAGQAYRDGLARPLAGDWWARPRREGEALRCCPLAAAYLMADGSPEDVCWADDGEGRAAELLGLTRHAVLGVINAFDGRSRLRRSPSVAEREYEAGWQAGLRLRQRWSSVSKDWSGDGDEKEGDDDDA